MLNTKEAQKTVIAFVAGLLIGGLLVWIFSEPAAPAANGDDDTDRGAVEEMMDDTEDADDADDVDRTATETDDIADADDMQTGDGSIRVADQDAGSTVTLSSAVFPTDEGWIGVRDYDDGEVGNILGVVRYSKTQGLVPESIRLLRPTLADEEYAVVFFTDNGDRRFTASTDTQIDGAIETFRAE